MSKQYDATKVGQQAVVLGGVHTSTGLVNRYSNSGFGAPVPAGSTAYASDLGPAMFDGSGWVPSGSAATSVAAAYDGVTDDSAAFSAALTKIGSNSATLQITGTMLVNANITSPANVQLAFVGKGRIKPASGKTFTHNGPISAGAWQIFDTSLGGTITGSIKNAEIPAEWFGAASDGATASGAAINNAMALALASGVNVRLLGGTYKTQDATLALGGTSFTRPTLMGCSKKQTILDYSAAGSSFIAIKVRGGSGQVTGDAVKDLTLVGNSTSIGIEYNGACGANADNVLFGSNAVGIQCHNETSGSFTEFCTATRCEQSTACAKFWTYKVTSGNNSFHGSGPGGGLDNLVQCGASQTIVVHALGTGCFVYHAPSNMQVFCTSGNVTIFQNDNSVAPIPMSLVGTVQIETSASRTITLGAGSSGGQIYFSGTIKTIGATNLTGDNIVGGTLLRVDTVQGHADSSLSYTGARAGRKYSLTVPSASTAAINISGPMNTVCRAVDVNVFATNFTKRNSLIVDFFGDGSTSVGPINIGTHASFDSPGGTLGYQSPTFSGSANGSFNIVVPTVAKTAGGAFTGGETSFSFSTSWQSPTGTYNFTFSNGDVRAIAVTQGSGGPYTISPAITSAATTAVTAQTWPVGSGVFTAYVHEIQQSNGLQAGGHMQF